MRKIILLLTCVTCLGCGDDPAETRPDPSTSNDTRAQTTDSVGNDKDVPVASTETSSAATASSSAAMVEASSANASVTKVRAVATGDSWTFHVTVDHPDTGWDDYADGWDVVLPDGTVVKPDTESPFTRLLAHPHENERPFTRTQSGIVIPAGVTSVTVRAHDLVDGFGGREVVVDLGLAEGEGFTVER